MQDQKQQPARQAFTPEFKQDAIRLALTGGKSQAAVARELGVRVGTLRLWIAQARQADRHMHLSRQVKEPGDVRELAAEVRRLQRENAVLREEREILKKATAFFAKGPR